MLIKVNFSSEMPIYIQLKDEIVKCIATGEFREGDYLPSIRQLGTELGINMHTVNKAYAILREEGLIVFDRRKGMRVVGIVENADIGVIDNIREDIKNHIARAICAGVAKDEYIAFCRDLFETFSKKWSERHG